MANETHTPGPWYWSSTTPDGWDLFSSGIPDQKPTILRTAFPITRADAKLIASAPVLAAKVDALEAGLQLAMDLLEDAAAHGYRRMGLPNSLHKPREAGVE